MITTQKVFFLMLMFGAIAIGNSLDCSVCNSATSWDDCQKKATKQTCTLAGVNEAHAYLATYNPNLVQGTAQDEFQCFAAEVVVKNATANEIPKAFARDCTFKKVDFCKGWLDRIELVKCGTNPSGDVVLSGGPGALSATAALVVAGFLGVYSRM